MNKKDVWRITRAEKKVQQALTALNEIDINNLSSQVDVVELTYHRTSLEGLQQTFIRWKDSMPMEESIEDESAEITEEEKAAQEQMQREAEK